MHILLFIVIEMKLKRDTDVIYSIIMRHFFIDADIRTTTTTTTILLQQRSVINKFLMDLLSTCQLFLLYID